MRSYVLVNKVKDCAKGKCSVEIVHLQRIKRPSFFGLHAYSIFNLCLFIRTSFSVQIIDKSDSFYKIRTGKHIECLSRCVIHSSVLKVAFLTFWFNPFAFKPSGAIADRGTRTKPNLPRHNAPNLTELNEGFPN